MRAVRHGGGSFMRVHWVAVPKTLRARRVNRRGWQMEHSRSGGNGSTGTSTAAAAAAAKGLGQPVWEYDPVGDACWTAGAPTPYRHLADCFAILVRAVGPAQIVAALPLPSP
jgi:hypothetical protein